MSGKLFYHKAIKDILALIDSGAFPAGSKLPSERDLAKHLGVSRPIIREAEKVLQAQGRIKIKVGAGVYVLKQSNFNNLPKAGAFELTQAHALFEAESAALAAPLITDEAISELESLIAIMVGNEEGEMTYEEGDALFHAAIARATNNRVIMFLTNSMWQMRTDVPEFQEVYRKVCGEGSNRLEDEHYAILHALKNRDPAAAREAMRTHFTHKIEVLLAASEEEAYREINLKISENRSRFLLSSQLN